MRNDDPRGASAVRRCKAGIVTKQTSPGLAPKTVRNIHAMIHRALVDAVVCGVRDRADSSLSAALGYMRNMDNL
jgi:hypothetical protein